MAGIPGSSLAGVLVLYHPDESALVAHIPTYLSFLNELFIVDNTEGALTSLAPILRGDRVRYMPNGVNEGVAAALNKGAAAALETGHDWLLTMDQDSHFEAADATAYFRLFREQLCCIPDVAVVSPLHGPSPKGLPEVEQVTATITSGSLVRLDVWRTLGGFDQRLFIDEVDHEYCYRAGVAGFKVMRVNAARLSHQLGTLREGGYVGHFSRRARRIHAPARVYYMVRNYLFVRAKYKDRFPGEFHRRDADILTMLKNNLFFSGRFFASLKAALRGYRDIRKGRLSDSKRY